MQIAETIRSDLAPFENTPGPGVTRRSRERSYDIDPELASLQISPLRSLPGDSSHHSSHHSSRNSSRRRVPRGPSAEWDVNDFVSTLEAYRAANPERSGEQRATPTEQQARRSGRERRNRS